MFKKLIFAVVGLTLVASILPAAAETASYKSCDQINDYVSYVKCIAEVDAKNNGAQTSTSTDDGVVAPTETPVTAPVASPSCQVSAPLSVALDINVKHAQVKVLKTMLACLGLLDKDDGLDLFDAKVEAAVKKFQEQNKLKCKDGTACGYVGPATRQAINALKTVAPAVPAADTTEQPETAPAVSIAKVELKNNLTVGSTGNEVKALQEYLATDKNIYPEGKVTGTFGPLTEAAVKRFQEKHGLKCKNGSFCGYVGVATRAKILELTK